MKEVISSVGGGDNDCQDLIDLGSFKTAPFWADLGHALPLTGEATRTDGQYTRPQWPG